MNRIRTASLVQLAIIAALAGGLEAKPATAPLAMPPPTVSDQIQVFNVSLKLVGCTERGTPCGERWRDYFKRLVSKPYKPDVLNVLEVPYIKKEAVVQELASNMNTPLRAWDHVHSDEGTACATQPATVDLLHCGNSMIVFRVPKFNKVAEHRFLRYEMNAAKTQCTTDSHPNSRDIAVKLQEKNSSGEPIADRTLVAAAVHLPPDLKPLSCVETSSAWIRQNVEQAPMDGNMTVVTGDFNRPPSGKATGAAETLAQRKEMCPAPWYKEWSLSQPTPDSSCAGGFNGSYRDAVRSKNSAQVEEICQEWTVWNQKAEPRPGACKAADRERKIGKRRIDFIWVRRTVGGTPTEPTIISASTDRGYLTDPSNWAGRYSDHRAVEALLSF